jgi:putative transposase
MIFADEVHSSLAPIITHTWALVNQAPMLKVSSSRKGITIIGGITQDGRVVAQHTENSMNALGFIAYLTFLLRVLPDEKLVVFVDNHPMHKTPEVKAFVLEHQERLGLEYVPTYAPECNPIEWLWAWVKGKLSMRVLDCLAELKEFWCLALSAAQAFGMVQKFWGASAIAKIC